MTPNNFNHFHHLSIIFQIFALKTDGELVTEERKEIQKLLNEWVDDFETTRNILIETSQFLSVFDESYPDRISDLLTYSATQILDSGVFNSSNLQSVLADLHDIALADSSQMSENESMFIAYIRDIWNLQ
jgi:hypothetical protein